MVEGLLREKEESLVPKGQTPYLSYSRVNRYLQCPEQYRLYYIENLRPKYPSASLVFGQVVHQSLALLFQKKEDPIQVFNKAWIMVKPMELTYSKKETWESLDKSGNPSYVFFILFTIIFYRCIHST